MLRHVPVLYAPVLPVLLCAVAIRLGTICLLTGVQSPNKSSVLYSYFIATVVVLYLYFITTVFVLYLYSITTVFVLNLYYIITVFVLYLYSTVLYHYCITILESVISSSLCFRALSHLE